nr:hypothetical protein GCM10020093_093670 [Planobispora longispora]
MPETLVAFLATASLGAIWSSCSPDFGAPSVIDRFTQIEPKVLITVDGYDYNGKHFDRAGVADDIAARLPSLVARVRMPAGGSTETAGAGDPTVSTSPGGTAGTAGASAAAPRAGRRTPRRPVTPS